MLELATLTAVAMAGAFAIRALVEYVVGKLVDALPSADWTTKVMPFVALAAGLGFAYWYNLDFFALLLNKMPDVVGVGLTGSLIGQGAEVVHQFVFEYILRDWLTARRAETAANVAYAEIIHEGYNREE